MNKHKILSSCVFVLACLVVGAAFMTATTYTQLTFAILIYPLLMYFALRAFPRRNLLSPFEKPAAAANQLSLKQAEIVGEAKDKNIGIADIDKRAFLKLIGIAGFSLFLFSIFNKKAEGLFFKSIPASGSVSLLDTAGQKIDPARSHPTDGYRISEIDDNIIAFHGFTDKSGAWFIMRGDTDTGSFRYSRGTSNFPGNWNNRAKLKYDYYNNTF